MTAQYCIIGEVRHQIISGREVTLYLPQPWRAGLLPLVRMTGDEQFWRIGRSGEWYPVEPEEEEAAA